MAQSPEDAKAVVNEHFEALNSHDRERVRGVTHSDTKALRAGMGKPAEYLASLQGGGPGGLMSGPPPADPVEGFLMMYDGLIATFPDMHIEVLEQVAVDDLVISRIHWTGTQTGEFVGVAPTNRKIGFDEVLFMKINDGHIGEVWAIAEEISMLEQLGAMPGASA